MATGVVDGMSDDWYPEELPTHHYLYKFVKEKLIRDGEVLAEAFHNVGVIGEPSYGMSTDWSKYSSPDETKNRPADKTARYGVARIQVGDVGIVNYQKAVHDPLFHGRNNRQNNRSHTNIVGPKSTKDGIDKPTRDLIRLKFVDLFEIIFEP